MRSLIATRRYERYLCASTCDSLNAIVFWTIYCICHITTVFWSRLRCTSGDRNSSFSTWTFSRKRCSCTWRRRRLEKQSASKSSPPRRGKKNKLDYIRSAKCARGFWTVFSWIPVFFCCRSWSSSSSCTGHNVVVGFSTLPRQCTSIAVHAVPRTRSYVTCRPYVAVGI